MTTTAQKFKCPRCKKRNMVRNGMKVHSKTKAKRQQWTCRDKSGAGGGHCYTTFFPEQPVRGENGKHKKPPPPRKAYKRKIDTSRIMVFTAAQNATPVHTGFFAALKTFILDWDAEELCVIPLRYKNPTSRWSESQANSEHWLRDIAAAELAEDGMDETTFNRTALKDIGQSWEQYLDEYSAKYLYEQRKRLNDNLFVVGDMKLQPTQQDPLTGVDGMTQGESGIFGHTKLRLKCLPTPEGKMPKILTTTGACTVANYTDSGAGKKGEHHHVLGAVVVEIKNNKVFHILHINARKSDGAFIFMDHEYHPDGRVIKAGPAQAVIFGDAHKRFADPEVVAATFREGGLVDILNPGKLVWHDLLDCYFGNPHHADNPFIKKAKHSANFHIAEDEVRETVVWAQELGSGRQNYVVASNHDDMFARWIIREDWKELDPENMEFYLETALLMAKSAKMSAVGASYLDPFGYWTNKITNNDPNFIALKRGQSLLIGGNECSYHGDKGPNGARGSVKNLSNIGVKLITGHGHTPEIWNGHTRVGTMTRLEAEYTSGPGSWGNAHASIDAWNKRHLHFCIDGDFGFNY